MKLIDAIVLWTCMLVGSYGASGFHDGRSFLFPVPTGSISKRPFPSFLPRFVSQAEVDALAIRTNALQEALTASLKPRCSPKATEYGAKVVGNFCYSVQTVAQNFKNAKRVCFEQGGQLAEPPYSDSSFFSNLKTSFAKELSDINITPMIIGAVSVDVGIDERYFKYIQSGVTIPANNNIWVKPSDEETFVTIETELEVVTLIPPAGDGTIWKIDFELISDLTMRPFICQYHCK